MIELHFIPNNMKELQKRHSTVTGVGAIFLIIQLLFGSTLSVNAQSEVSFTSEDIFEMPSKNSSIRFAVNGTYEEAKLEDGVWSFQSLYMSDLRGTKKLNMTISATECDLIFYPYLSAPYSYGVALLEWVILAYTVSGHGTQVINLGLDPDNSQLDVILDGNFAARNQGWTKSDDGTLTIAGSYSNVTLWYIGHPEPSEEDSFLSEHYLMIVSIAFFAVIVVLAVVIKQRKREVSAPLNKTNVRSNPEKALGGQ